MRKRLTKEKSLALENKEKTLRRGYTSSMLEQNKKLDLALSQLFRVISDLLFKTENILRGSQHKPL
jgi:hypothetical protein